MQPLLGFNQSRRPLTWPVVCGCACRHGDLKAGNVLLQATAGISRGTTERKHALLQVGVEVTSGGHASFSVTRSTVWCAAPTSAFKGRLRAVLQYKVYDTDVMRCDDRWYHSMLQPVVLNAVWHSAHAT